MVPVSKKRDKAKFYLDVDRENDEFSNEPTRQFNNKIKNLVSEIESDYLKGRISR